jgi:branched-chain amino acid transport system permease protein
MSRDLSGFLERVQDTIPLQKPYSTIVAGGLLFSFMALLPWATDASLFGWGAGPWFSVQLLILIVTFAFTAQAWNIMSGFTGYFSFGHAAFFGLGAYITMKLTNELAMNPWYTLIIGGIVAMLLGLVIGFLNFRYNLRGHYFALSTFAFAVLVQASISNMEEFNGTAGYYRPFPRDYGADYGLWAFQFREPEPYYFLMLGFLVLITIIAWTLKNSQWGLYLLAIRENEQAAQSMGIPVYRFKMFAIAVSAFFTAWAGTFWSMRFNTVRPTTVFSLFRNVEILLAAVLGGVGTIAGPILGALVLFPLAEITRSVFGDVPGANDIVYGAVLIVMAIMLPGGLLSLRDRFQGGGEEDEPTDEPSTEDSAVSADGSGLTSPDE